MELGLHLANLTFAGGPPTVGADVARLAKVAEDGGFRRVTVMDHLWQIRGVGPETDPMLEAYTTLGYLAAVTRRVRLHVLVTGVVYRPPGLLAKTVTTLDVLSGGRAGLGIGAAWNEDESRGLGLPFPSTAERFERLEEALRICMQMWGTNDGPFDGAHYHLGRTLSSPPNLSNPRPPIMIGGGGEKKTLRLVARYADACNLFPGGDLQHKLDVLREHCAAEGRDFDTVERTTTSAYDPAGGPAALLEALRAQHELGVAAAYLMVPGPEPQAGIEQIAAEVVPEVSAW